MFPIDEPGQSIIDRVLLSDATNQVPHNPDPNSHATQALPGLVVPEAPPTPPCRHTTKGFTPETHRDQGDDLVDRELPLKALEALLRFQAAKSRTSNFRGKRIHLLRNEVQGAISQAKKTRARTLRGQAATRTLLSAAPRCAPLQRLKGKLKRLKMKNRALEMLLMVGDM